MTRPRVRTVLLAGLGVCLAILLAVYVWFRPGLVPMLMTGAPVPDFSLPAHGSDSPVSLASYKGKVVLVHFWATWCAPCRVESPSLERLYQKHRGESFEILAISEDKPGSAEAIEKFRSDLALSFPILLDETKSAFKSYLVWGLPETFVVGHDGKLVEHHVGDVDWDRPEFSRAIQDALERARISP